MKFFKLPYYFDPHLLSIDLLHCQSLEWIDHFNKEDYQGDWSVISLRSHFGKEADIQTFASSDYQNTPLLENCPYFQKVIATFLCEKQSIRLMQLAPGSKIKNHKDPELGYEDGFFRLHIPIMTEKQVVFYFDDSPVHMGIGECWYGNFNLIHRVEHHGALPRVHLVLDCVRNEWTDQIFKEGGYDFKREEMIKREKHKKDIPAIIERLEFMNTETSRLMIIKLKKQLDGEW